jgi:hypothetical protein
MKLEYLMEYTADVQLPVRNAGSGPFGVRGLAVVSGGAFAGPRLKGTLWTGGGDWWLRGPDGVLRLDVRATFETDDGALIYGQYYGVLRPEGGRALAPPGQPSEYGDAYFMTTPRFETGDERYSWLNGLVCVAEGKRTAQGLSYRVYAVVNA